MEFVTRKLGELAEWICNDGIRRVNNLMKLPTSIKTLRDKKIKDLGAKESDIKAKLQIENKQRKQPLEELAESVEEEVSKEVDELIGKQFPDGLVIEKLPAKATLFNSLSLLRNQSTTTEKTVEEMNAVAERSQCRKDWGVWNGRSWQNNHHEDCKRQACGVL
ncbi:hypothetical protein Sjap_025513 [Stephania japonica]|uniref:Uncharacterized protein n=1 Tax=Stephania japonica TaxID=461633 RepID=A0AAP0E5C4_9MAGN